MQFRSTIRRIILGIIIAVYVSTVTAQTVLRHSDSNAPLKQRWEWAEKQSKDNKYRNGCWIAYSIEKLMGKHSYTGSFSTGWKEKKTLSEIVYGKKIYDDEAGLSDAEIIRREARRALDELKDKDRPEEKVLKEVAILFEITENRSISDVKMSNLSLYVDLEGLPLIWLGKT
ncbi:MAG: hypothetical protein ABIL68_07650, partial [bacterium]